MAIPLACLESGRGSPPSAGCALQALLAASSLAPACYSPTSSQTGLLRPQAGQMPAASGPCPCFSLSWEASASTVTYPSSCCPQPQCCSRGKEGLITHTGLASSPTISQLLGFL